MFRLPRLLSRVLASLGCLVVGAVVVGGAPARADVVRAGADITIVIGTGIDTCAIHADSDCFTTDQGWYVDVYDVAATLNEQGCVDLPGGYGTYISETDFSDSLTPHPSAGIEMRAGSCANGTLDPADQFPEGVPSRLIDPVDASYDHQSNQTYRGDATFYDVGLGACGQTASDNDLVAAISEERFDAATPNGNPNANPNCGKKIRLTRGDKSVTVKIIDKCAACGGPNIDDVDLSPAAFDQLAAPSEGRIALSEQYVS